MYVDKVLIVNELSQFLLKDTEMEIDDDDEGGDLAISATAPDDIRSSASFW